MFLINRVSKSYNRVLIFIAFSLINSVSLADFSSIDIKSYKIPPVRDEGLSVFSEAQCCEAPKVKLPTKSADVKQEILFYYRQHVLVLICIKITLKELRLLLVQ